MTANELADKLQNEKAKTLLYVATIVDSANMLRQQQAEIGALKQIIDANNLNQNIGQFVKPANEPVAWKHKPSGIIFDEIIEAVEPDDLVPLYEHPMRYLTDEKIWKLWQTHLNDDITVFARAILRKASEK